MSGRFLLSHLWTKKATPETVDAEQYAEAFGQFKKLLLEQYQIRIQAKTAKRLPINLSAKPTHFGTSPERAALYFNDLTIESEDITTEIDKILNTHQRLLLIGDPGAGKTTILLFAAINILMEESREQKLPLILNLATWQKERDFKEWYAQSIAHTYSLSPVFVEELLRRNAVVPFFDGFDEVGEDSREDCFQKMAAYFGDQRSRQLIVCSRKKEYAAAKAAAPVYAQVEVQPLSLTQIQKALFENGQTYAGDLALLYALDRDEYLAKAVETPFYLNTASFLFGESERTLADFTFKAKSSQGRQEELIKVFVAEQVPDGRDRKHLSFLAGKKEEENFLVFELMRMQPNWCGRIWKWQIIFIVTFSSIAGLVTSLAIAVDSGSVDVGFAIGFVAGFATGFVDILNNRKFIVLIEIQSWSLKYFLHRWKEIIRERFGFGLLSGIIFGITLGLFIGWLGDGYIYKFEDFFGPIITASIVCGAFLGLIDGLKLAGFQGQYLLHLPKPYIRYHMAFRRSLWNVSIIVLTILVGLIVSRTILFHETFKESVDALINRYTILLTSTLFVALPFLHSKFVHHFALRFILYLENKLPLRLVTFLDRMTNQHIFEDNRRTIGGKKQRGATWRFRHKLLQDYFAGLNTEKH